MLNSLKQFLKTRWVFVLLGLIIIILTVVKQQAKKPETLPPLRKSPSPFLRPQESPQPSTPPSVSWKEITINQTTKNELEDKLGTPLKQEVQEDFEIQFYPSTNKYRPHTVILQQDKVVFIKEEIIDPSEKNLKDYIEKYGQPDTVLYNVLAKVGFAVHVFLNQGLAVTANPNDGTILEVWYFGPTGQSSFLKTWGKDLKKTPPRVF